jgi:hypothetical protein
MAGYNRGIVATRKLNERNKARLRSTGDTEFGFIKGRLSHINKEEKGRLTAADAYDISLRERVEKDIAEKGAGTINPFTGMPEYHAMTIDENANPETSTIDRMKVLHNADLQDGVHMTTELTKWGNPIIDYSQAAYDAYVDAGGTWTGSPYQEQDLPLTGRQDYETLSTADDDVMSQYLADEFGLTGGDYTEYITPFQEEPFDFLKRDRYLAGKRITLGGDKLTSTRDLTLEGLTGQQETLGRTTGRAYGQATRGAEMAMGRSGLATSGTITSGLKKQMKELTTDYTAGTQEIGRQKRGAQADYDFGMAGFKLDRYGANLALDKGTWLEEQRQLGLFYDEIGDIPVQ